MPTVGAFVDVTQGYLRDRTTPEESGQQSLSLLSPEDRTAVSRKLFDIQYQENRTDNWAQSLAKYAAGSYINLADDLYGNFLIPGTEKGDIWDFVKDYGGQRGRALESHYRNHAAAIDTISGITGAIGTAVLTNSLVLPKIASKLASSTSISQSPLWMSGQAMNASIRAGMIEAQMDAAVKAETFFALRSVATRGRAGLKFMGLEASKVAGIALAEEVAIAATLNANQGIWADDLSTNLLFAGVGASLGGTLGAVAARAEMRRVANSPLLTRMRADAMDPQGFLQNREVQPDAAALRSMFSPDLYPKESATFTSLRLVGRQDIGANIDPALASKFDRLRTAATEQAQLSLQKMGSKGIESLHTTPFKIDQPIGKHIIDASWDDPLLLHGLDSIGSIQRTDRTVQMAATVRAIPTDDPFIKMARKDFAQNTKTATQSIGPLITAAMNTGMGGIDLATYRAELQRLQNQAKHRATLRNRNTVNSTPLGSALEVQQDYISALRASGEPEHARRAAQLEKQQPLALINGKFVDATHPDAKGLSAYVPNKVRIKQTTRGAAHFSFTTQLGRTFRISDAMTIRYGNKTVDFAKLRIADRLEILDAQEQMFTHLLRKKYVYTLPDQASWFQIDSALRYKERGGKIDVLTQAGYKSDNDLVLASLKAKAAATKGVDLGDNWNRLAYNLPSGNALERIYDSSGDTIRAMLDAAERGATETEVRELYKQLKRAHGFATQEEDIALAGNMYTFNRDKDGKWRDIALGFFDNDSVMNKRVQYAIAEQLAEQKAFRIQELTASPTARDFVPEITEILLASPSLKPSMNLMGMSNDQITGLDRAQALGEFVTREFRYRDQKTMLSVLQSREILNKATDLQLSKMVKEELGDIIPRLNAAPAGSSKVLVNQFASNSAGWDLEAGVLQNGRYYSFTLAESGANAKRLGRPVQRGEPLVNPRTGKEIVVDDLGLEYLTRFQSVAKTILVNKNRIRAAFGLPPLHLRNWYVPPADTRFKHVAFTLDENNKAVPGGAIIAKTRQELEEAIAKKAPTLQPGEKLLTREDIKANVDLFDQAQIDWIDPGIVAAPSKTQKGALSSDLVNPHAVQDMLTWIQNQTEYIGNGIMRTLYDSQLSIARARSAVERGTHGLENSPIRTIWDEYEMTVMGKSLGDPKSSISGSLVRPIERFIDARIEDFWPAMRAVGPTQLGNWVGDLLHRVGMRSPKAFKTFDALTTELGQYTPYKDAVDFAEQTLRVSYPPEVRKMAQSLNKLSSGLLLRYFELGHSAMNLFGIVTTMPSILMSGRAPVSLYMSQANKSVPVVDATKILMDSMHDMFRRRSHPDWQYMEQQGFTTQPVAEFFRQMSMVQDQQSWKKVFIGDESVPAPTRTLENFTSRAGLKNMAKRKGIEGMISVATDTTESWSRTYSHFVGLRLADYHGITGQAARHAFAHEIANAAIANYSPLNRPEVFQSAFGSMAGLFMSWMQSYNQRLFRWMEDGQYSSVMQQLGMQSALFGVASMPGFNYLQNFLLASGVGQTTDGREANIVDHIYARFGTTLGSAIAHGSLAQSNIVLYTRGDMNYRDVTLDPTRLAAGLSIGYNVVKAIQETTESLMSDYSVEDSGRISEILARNMPNRVMKGWIAVLGNEGNDIDAYGAVVSQTRGSFESAVRMLGLRSTRQQAEVEAFYANRNMQDREAARMDVLRRETRALLRGDPKNIDAQLLDVFSKYVDAGGRPDHFRQWIIGNIREATSTRGMNDIRKALSNPDNLLRIWRYDAYGAGPM